MRPKGSPSRHGDQPWLHYGTGGRFWYRPEPETKRSNKTEEGKLTAQRHVEKYDGIAGFVKLKLVGHGSSQFGRSGKKTASVSPAGSVGWSSRKQARSWTRCTRWTKWSRAPIIGRAPAMQCPRLRRSYDNQTAGNRPCVGKCERLEGFDDRYQGTGWLEPSTKAQGRMIWRHGLTKIRAFLPVYFFSETVSPVVVFPAKLSWGRFEFRCTGTSES